MEAFLKSQEMIRESIDETLDLMGPEENLNKYVELVEKRLKKYGQTGDVKHLHNIFGENPIKKRHKKGSKENISTDSTKHPSKTPKEKVSQNVLEITEEVVVKQEMPPPTMLPKRGRPKKQAIVIKKEPEDKFRDSDVILQVPVIPTIDLNESDELRKSRTKAKISQVEPKSTSRSTRATTTKIKVVEELKDHSSIYEDALPQVESNLKPVADDINTKLSNDKNSQMKEVTNTELNKNSNRRPSGDFYTPPPKIVDTSPYSISKGTITKSRTMEQAINETIIIQKPRVLGGTIESNAVPVKKDILNKDNNEKPSRDGPTLNETIVRPRVLNETIVLHKGPSKDGALKNKIIKDIMTDDKDPPIVEKTATTSRMTRTKTRKLKEYEEDQKLQVEEANQKVAKQDKSGASKQKTSATSPLVGAANKFNFKSGSASAKPNRFFKTPELSTKAITAYKASQEEYREREKQKRERDADVLRKKEDEALQKKEAMLQASIEQKKKKREEKELKAKEHREALEQAEKQKVLVMQKQKEEKHKMNLLGIAEKLQKNKEESERKRLLIKQKKQEMLRKHNPSEEEHKPIYLVKKMPLLPTYDCYDSDEKDFPESRMEKPAWLKREKMYQGIRVEGLIKKIYVNTLYCLKARTPNLEDIFENIDPKKLERKSSAVWKNQPRFTCMPKIHEAH